MFGDDQWWGVQGGASVDLFGFKLAGSVATDNVGDTTRNFFTAGIGWGYGPLNTSVTYGQIFDTNSDFDEATGIGDKAYNLVFSADYALAPGLVLAGDVASFDNDATADTGTGDKGWTAVGSVRLAFLISSFLKVGCGGARSRRIPFQDQRCCLLDTVAVQECLTATRVGCGVLLGWDNRAGGRRWLDCQSWRRQVGQAARLCRRSARHNQEMNR